MGQTISRILFASYGLPLGICDTPLEGYCHATNSLDVANNLCLGQSICSIPVNNALFGHDPCASESKKFSVRALCSSGSLGPAPGGAGGVGGSSGNTPGCNKNGIVESDLGEECDEGSSESSTCKDCKFVCTDGYISIDRRRCYRNTPSSNKDWNGTRGDCTAMGAGFDLASLGTIDEVTEIRTWGGIDGSRWIGGRRSPSARNTMPRYAWPTSEPWYFGPSLRNHESGAPDSVKIGPAYGPWDDGEPNGVNGGAGQDCVELKFADGVEREFNDTACSQQRRGLCEAPIPGTRCNHDGKLDKNEECDDGNKSDGDGCSSACTVECPSDNDVQFAFKDPTTHHCYVSLKDFKNNTDAISTCKAWGDKRGGGFHLARIETIPEFRFLSVEMRRRGDIIHHIDGTDGAAEGTWRFVTRDAPLPFSPFLKQEPWNDGEPNGGIGENCLALWWFGDAYMFADIGCGSGFRPLCERDAQPEP
jgi:cysteine-rich repeat protein